MLRRMAAGKLIKCQSFSTSIADWFMLPSTRGLQEPKYKHEVGAADLFTAFYPYLREESGKWGYEPQILKERADRAMRLFSKTFYFEVDRGTEPPSEIYSKLDNYIRYAQETGERFHVIFALMDGKKPAQKRGEEIIQFLVERQRGNQFLIASHARLIQDPLGELLFSPKNELYSVQNVI
jgi:AAA+ ATPase superfamily predicted ATPase